MGTPKGIHLQDLHQVQLWIGPNGSRNQHGLDRNRCRCWPWLGCSSSGSSPSAGPIARSLATLAALTALRAIGAVGSIGAISAILSIGLGSHRTRSSRLSVLAALAGCERAPAPTSTAAASSSSAATASQSARTPSSTKNGTRLTRLSGSSCSAGFGGSCPCRGRILGNGRSRAIAAQGAIDANASTATLAQFRLGVLALQAWLWLPLAIFGGRGRLVGAIIFRGWGLNQEEHCSRGRQQIGASSMQS